jgi:hypothetical protein
VNTDDRIGCFDIEVKGRNGVDGSASKARGELKSLSASLMTALFILYSVKSYRPEFRYGYFADFYRICPSQSDGMIKFYN